MSEQLAAERRKKAEAIRASGLDPYPARVTRTHTAAEFALLAEGGAALAGRVTSLRGQGALSFMTLEDGTGAAQVVLRREETAGYEELLATLDIGDFVEVAGAAGETKRGTLSLFAAEARVISKAVRAAPVGHYALEDKETLLRQRYLDLLVHPELRATFVAKSRFWASIRGTLEGAGFVAVETPVLETLPGGAEAEPFRSHHDDFGMDVYLRIAPELWLKRLMVAGFEKVYEIGRIFRNEGSSPEHLQDFTSLEFYWAYQDYRGLMGFVEGLVKEAVRAVTGGTETRRGGETIEWGNDWPRLEYYDLFEKANGLDLAVATKEQLLARAKELDIGQADATLGRGRLIDLVYKKTVRPTLVQPCYLINPPVEISPLAKRLEGDGGRVERFQLLAGGTELCNGFTELNDPDDQRARFVEQARLREEGDAEAMRLDEDYLEAMEYGMPPTAGVGLGDRLFATIVDKPIRETVLFPLVKPK